MKTTAIIYLPEWQTDCDNSSWTLSNSSSCIWS